jgi:hypothetical protein
MTKGNYICLCKNIFSRLRVYICNDPPPMTQYCPLLASHTSLRWWERAQAQMRDASEDAGVQRGGNCDVPHRLEMRMCLYVSMHHL